MFKTRNDRFPVKNFRIYLAKCPVDFGASGPFYLAVIYDPTCAIWFKRCPMGVRTTNNIIISITGHSTEAGLDPYNIGDKKQQQALFHLPIEH